MQDVVAGRAAGQESRPWSAAAVEQQVNSKTSQVTRHVWLHRKYGWDVNMYMRDSKQHAEAYGQRWM